MDGIATQAGMVRGPTGSTFPAPTHYWNLDTTSFVDSAGGWSLTQNDGTVTINSTGGPDGGPAVDLDLSEELIRSGGETWDGSQDELTISIWAKIDAFSNIGNWLFSWRGNTASPNDRFVQILAFNSSKKIIVQLFDTSGIIVDETSTSTLTTGVWYHIVITHDGNNFVLYINNTSEATATTTSFGGYPTPTMPLALGAASWSLNFDDTAHDGMLAKCGVWDVALTAAEVSTLYNSGNGLDYADL